MASSETTYKFYMFHLDQHEINDDERCDLPKEEVTKEVTKTSTDSRIEAFAIYVHIVIPSNDDIVGEDQDEIERATMESEDEFQMVLATESSI
ncbi:hypothetical protein L484_019106 [Morus notabilis]|uniref:Uncharacterized protein n=1 Tax=Morus notabilis TaxID=981085 RepID=W9SBG4_9ROSA|nr:hypothetical protein L484_019106 [Morus notabilis]